MNGTESAASNRKRSKPTGGNGGALRRAKDAYVAGYGIAHKYGSDSPEFEKGFAEFEAALGVLTESEAGAFDLWQRTHVVAQNLQTGKLEAVDPRSMKHPADHVADLDVVQWFREIDAGKRVPQILESVPLRSIRPNPFVLEFDEGLVRRIVTSLRKGETDAWLVVASLPDGTFIDVDSPYPCEALKREGRDTVKVTVVGSFKEEKCSRLGLMPWATKGGTTNV
ncbi:MAG: hypothetical protein M3P18_15615 [Actinomycetota bacterium]|nr:hypothetical protein [Actinomycetota bacterium]